MIQTQTRWLIGGLAGLLLMAGGYGLGCNETSEWEHPNRQRYPAPPQDDDLILSVEELEERWREEDLQEVAASPASPAARTERATQPEQLSEWSAIDIAMSHVRRAVDAAIDRATPLEQPPAQPPPAQSQDGPPVGGGPSEAPPETPNAR